MRFATPTQRHLVIAAELRPQDPSPNWALLSRLPSGTDAGRFADAVASTLNANQAFTEIFERDGEGRVVVTASPVRPPVEVVEYPDLAAVQAEVARWGDHAFDLSVAPLYHAEIGVVGSDSYFMFAGAHVLSDGFGFYNLIADFAGHYADSGYRSPDTSSPADTLEPLTRNRFEVVRHFARIFDGMTALQIDGWDRRDSRGRIPGGISRCELPFRDYQAAKALGASVGARRYAVLLSVLAVTVGCLAGVDTVVVSTPMSNRRSGLASQTTRGVRVNALPVRCYIGAETVFADLCRRTEEQIRGLIDFEQHAFSEFSRTLFPAASMDSTQPSVGFTLYPRPLAAVVGGRTGETINVDRRFLQYPLTVDIEVDEGAATLIVERADHLPHTDIGALYTHVLRQVLDSDARIRLGEITWTSGELASSVPPVTEFPARTMAAEFAAAAARHADEVAVVSDDARLTYRELDALSDAIAAWVHAAVPDRLVGVAMAPSIRFVATVLALFKSGKVYVPLDPSSPPARLAAMTAQCGATTALADRCDTLSIPGIRLLELPAEPEESAPAPTAPDVDDQAYLLFTSGTTGVPKGVPVTHRAATRFYDGLRRETGIGRARWLLFHSISFDVSLVEIFAALFAGGTVCVPAPEVKRDPRRLAEFVRRHRIEAVLLTPSAFAMLADRFTGIDSIRHLLIGGERLEYPLLTEFVTARGDVAVWNCYGITETTMYHTAFPVPPDPGRFPAESVIGRPFADMGMAVVDDRLRVLPRGVRGQLVVSGAGLMAGYLNRDELTAEKFVTIEGVRSYLTGDRGHLDAEGRFVISGRIDNQVKIRGHRCELGDIEAALYRTGLVANTHVALDGSGLTAELVCFVVPVGAATMPQLRERLREYLPRYLEPDIFVPLETLPLNTNGKVDDDELFRRYRADADTATAAGAGESAGTGVDDVVTQVWTEVLGTSDFEGTTRFFDAGGTSAMVLQVGERLRTRLGLAELDVVDLFEHCTPDTLSGFLADKV